MALWRLMESMVLQVPKGRKAFQALMVLTEVMARTGLQDRTALQALLAQLVYQAPTA